MDQSQNNLERIRALDAEEGEWRTINGAHVLIKNGRIAAGAGGALNGQRFQGHSIKKMAAGTKGHTVESELSKNTQALSAENNRYVAQKKALEQTYGEAANRILGQTSKLEKREGIVKRGLERRSQKAREKADTFINAGREAYNDLRGYFGYYASKGELESQLKWNNYKIKRVSEGIIATKYEGGKKKFSVEIPRDGNGYDLDRININMDSPNHGNVLASNVYAGEGDPGYGDVDNFVDNEIRPNRQVRGRLANRHAEQRAALGAEFNENHNNQLKATREAEAEHQKNWAKLDTREQNLKTMRNRASEYLAAHPELKRGGRATQQAAAPAPSPHPAPAATPNPTRASGPSQPPASSTPDFSARPGHAIGYQDGMRFAAKRYKDLPDNELKSELQEAKSGVERWSKLAARNPGDYDIVKQVGFYTGVQKAIQKQLDNPLSTTPGRFSKIKPLTFNFRGKNYNKEAKRIAHNARVYHRTARRAYEKAEREARSLGEAARIPHSQLPEYKRKLSEKMDKRDFDATGARQKLIGMQERTRALKRRWPDLFVRRTPQQAAAPTTSQSPASSPAPSPIATSRRPTLGRMKPGMTGRGTASELARTRKADRAETARYNQKVAETERKYNGIHYRINEEMNALPRTAPDFRTRMAQLEKASAKSNRANEQSRRLSSNIHLSRMDKIRDREDKLQNALNRASEYLAAHPEVKRGGRPVPALSSPSSAGRRLGRVPAGYTGKNYDKETKRLTHNAQVYHRTARRAMEKKAANSTPSEYQDYERRMNENMQRRDSDAASAKNRLASMRKMAKALKQSHPEVFAKTHALKAKMSGR